MKLFGTRFSKASTDSRFGPVSRASNDSKLGSLFPHDAEDEAEEAREAARDAERARKRAEIHELRKELLRMVLAKTVQKTNVPPAWIGGELNAMVLESGEEWIEVRLSVQVDEPRLLTYLTSFQAEFERRLLAAAPDAKEWLAGTTWKFTPDAIYELPVPQAQYWEQVQADRLLTARQKGAVDWDRESLERHFSDTNPGEMVVDFEDTSPPERRTENILEPPKSS
ncbi:MAG TPA: hypothetical protein VMZ74_17465 [Ramlibacter sp.]|nr:hypothetical protein [Ramlibacter sp.]